MSFFVPYIDAIYTNHGEPTPSQSRCDGCLHLIVEEGDWFCGWYGHNVEEIEICLLISG